MRRFIVILTVLWSFKCFSYEEYLFYPQGRFIFTSQNYGPYLLSGFSFQDAIIHGVEKNQQEVLIGSVEKIDEWTRAYVFKVGDTIMSTHRAYFFSSGTLLNCLKMYEIYDENNELIGFIEGVWDTNAAACFYFYKENQECFAKATLDLSSSKLTISSPDDEIIITGRKILNVTHYSLTNQYYWRIKKEKEHPFNTFFLWPFMGFLSEVWWR